MADRKEGKERRTLPKRRFAIDLSRTGHGNSQGSFSPHFRLPSFPFFLPYKTLNNDLHSHRLLRLSFLNL